jgi:hypothetical protein
MKSFRVNVRDLGVPFINVAQLRYLDVGAQYNVTAALTTIARSERVVFSQLEKQIARFAMSPRGALNQCGDDRGRRIVFRTLYSAAFAAVWRET